MAILSIGELLGIGPDQLSGFVPYTAVEGSGGLISGINGSGISGMGGTDTTAVSAIASAYAESAASGKLDNSASSQWYPMTGNPSGFLTSVDLTNYATTAYVDSSLSGKMDTSEASAFYPMSGNPSGFLVPGDITGLATTAYVDSSVSAKVDQSAFDDCCSSVQSALSGKQDASEMSAYALSSDVSGVISVVESSSASWGAGDYTGIVPVYVDNTGRTINISSMPLGVDSSMTAYVSGDTMLFGVDNTVLSILSSLSAWAGNNGWTGI